MPRLALALIAPLLLLGPAPKLEWRASLAEAKRVAAEEGRVVFVLLDHAGEGRSDALLKLLEKDKALAPLAARAVCVPAAIAEHKASGACPRFKGVTCLDHRLNEAALREGVLQPNDVGVLATPQCAWLDGEGRVLLSVPYEVDAAGLAWCFQEAEHRLDAARPAPGPGARPPRRLLTSRTYKARAGDTSARGMTADELERALEESKKSLTGMANYELTFRVMFTDEPDAVPYVDTALNGMRLFGRDRLPTSLRWVGTIAPPRFWEVLEGFARENDPALRREVAAALEQLGAPAAAKLAKASLAREEDAALVGAWARAYAACAPEDKGALKALLALGEDGATPAQRAAATWALGWLERQASVRERWTTLLGGADAQLAAAAACGAALARDEAMQPVLEAARDATQDEVLKATLERALAVLAGGDLFPLAADVARVTDDDVARDRVFFGGPPRVPEGGGGGGR